MNRKLFNLIQWTWGLPQTLIGAALYLRYSKDEHFDYKGAAATIWNRDGGASLGKFIFVPRGRHDGADPFLTGHEYGHSLQSLILGPAYLLLIGLPSLMWNRLPVFARHRRKTGRSYYSAPFESSANRLGHRDTRR